MNALKCLLLLSALALAVPAQAQTLFNYQIVNQLCLKGRDRPAVQVTANEDFKSIEISLTRSDGHKITLGPRALKEGQTYVMPIYLLAAVPVVVTLDPELRLTPTLALVPFVNSTLLFREALEGNLETLPAVLSLACSAATAVFALWLGARVLSRESIATGGYVPFSWTLARLFRAHENEEIS